MLLAYDQGMDAHFETLRARFLDGSLSVAGNRLVGLVTPPEPGDLRTIPADGTSDQADLMSVGREELDTGKVGLVVLAGGMATRFQWDQPKALFPIHEGLSFLGWKLLW
ncbi:MAG: hypothetical protein EBU81_11030, partial [Proteobacteria bacterium]|nr:hypothetical protein [Pseudomonadota bacterium]